MDNKIITNFDRYMQTYAYSALVKKHALTEKGIWIVKGEDPNCDLHGHHYQPTLGYFEGTLLDVIKVAVELKDFFSWGAGGDIKKVIVRSTEDFKDIEKLKKQRDILKKRIAEIEKRLKP